MSGMSRPYIRGTAQVGWFEVETREARLRWFGHAWPTEGGLWWEKDAEDGTARK